MRPDSDASFAVRQINIWMMALFFGDGSNLDYEIERGFEIGKVELPFQMVRREQRPILHLLVQGMDFAGSLRRHSPSAWNALFLSKLRHECLPPGEEYRKHPLAPL